MDAPGIPFAGRSVGDFVLGDKLGQGAFGAVYAATQRGLGREAAVKVLRPSVAVARDGTARFLREAQLAAQLDHPYAAHVYAFGAESDGLLWIAMERVRGTTLGELIQTSGPLSIDQFVPLFERICEVVQTAHEQGIVHRDLKPANVMVLSRAGRLLPKLLDFGIARTVELGIALAGGTLPLDEPIASSLELDRTARVGLTGHGQILGSPGYMAPEQWNGDDRVGPWSDQYALAVLAYEALVGTLPFRASSLDDLVQQHRARAFPVLPPTMPASMSEMLVRAASKRPEDRFASVSELATALRESAGFAPETRDGLPALTEQVHDAWTSDGPQPIAESIAQLARARSAAQAEDAIATTAGVIARWLGLLALAAVSKHASPAGDDRLRVVRELRRRILRDDEWLALARSLAADSAVVPELTAFLSSPSAVALEHLLDDANRRRGAALPEVDARRELAQPVADLAKILDELAWLCDYTLARHIAGTYELWMGCSHDDRVHTSRRSDARIDDGAMVLVDRDGVEVVLLSPIVQVVLTGSDRATLLLFAGATRDGHAQLLAMPRGLEREDDAIWPWLRSRVLDDDDESGDDRLEPWLGLSPFGADDGARFVGREPEVTRFVELVRTQPLVVLVGPSGVGKTSFLQAGVLPALPPTWRALTIRPGRSPFDALGAALRGGGSDGPYRQVLSIDDTDLAAHPDTLGERLRTEALKQHATFVLVIDAFEELFTLGVDEVERDQFVAGLAAAASSPEAPVRVVIAMRDDFLCRAEALSPLRGRLGRALQLLATPQPSDLERILTVPATRAGYTFDDPGLPAEMVTAVRDQPGALPLLSFTAARLFELRDRHFRRLRRASYDEIGGVTGALVRHADGAIDRMSTADRAVVRRLFSRLVTPEGTRARLGRVELASALGERGDEVIDRLLAARLLVSSDRDDGERVEVIHETLLTAWPRLVGWRHDDHDGARFRAQLATATRQWDERGRPRDLLWRGETVAELRGRIRRDEPLTPSERAFATASLAAEQRGRRRVITALVAVSIMLASGAGILWRANRRVSEEREEALRQVAINLVEHGRHAVLDNDPALGLLYLAEAAKRGARGPGFDLLVRHAITPLVSDAGGATALGQTNAVTRSAGGRVVVVASEDHHSRVFDTATGALVATLTGHDAPVLGAAVSADGEDIVTTSFTGEVIAWKRGHLQWRAKAGADRIYAVDLDAKTGLVVTGSWDHKVRLFALSDGSARGEVDIADLVTRVRIDPTGRAFAAATPAHAVWIYAVAGLTRLGTIDAGEGYVLALAFAQGGTILATASQDHAVRLWNVATSHLERTLSAHTQSVLAIETSHDGTRLATSSSDGTARVWNLASGESIVTPAASMFAINAVHFSPDDKQIVTAGVDHAARIWDSTTGMPVANLSGHAGPLSDAVFDPAGTHVITAGRDGVVKRWNVGAATTSRRFAHGGHIIDLRISPDGRRFATASEDGSAVVWNIDGHRGARIDGHRTESAWIDFDRTSTRLVVGDAGGNVDVYDAADGRLRTHILQPKPVNSVRFTHDGDSVMTASDDGVVRVWDAATGSLRAETKVEDGEVNLAELSPRGDRAVAIGGNATVLALPSLTKVAAISKPSARIVSILFSPDGSSFALAGVEHVVGLYDAATGTPRLTLDTHGGAVNALRFRPDGVRLVVANEDATAQIWDSSTGRLVSTLSGHGGPIFDADWSPDGELVVTASSDGTARVWDATTSQPLLVLVGHTNFVRNSMFSSDGNHVVTTSDDGSAILWDTARDHRDAEALDALVRCLVPYQLVDGVVLPATPDPHACQ